MSALAAAANRRLALHLAGFMRDIWPDICEKIGPEALRLRCERGVADARALGFHTDRAIARFLNLRFALGDDFPRPVRDSAIEAALRNRNATEQERLHHAWGVILGRGSK